MKPTNPIEVFSKLRKVISTEDVEHVLMASRDFYDFDEYSEMEEVESDFAVKHRALVNEVANVWGAPSFDGAMSDDNFPEWYEAVAIAYWVRDHVTFYVALRHDDKELPFILVLGVRENDRRRL